MKCVPFSLLLALTACGETPAPEPAPTPAVAPPAAPALPPAPQTRTAKVLEVLPSGQYTIARMDACGQEAWVAGPVTELKVDQLVEMPMGMVMTDFDSPSLQRKFDTILFVDWLKETTVPPVCPPTTAAAPGAPPHGAPKAGPPGTGADAKVGVVKETMAAAGYTYALLDVCGKAEWIAGPATPLQVGNTVSAVVGPAAAPMTGFSSPTLKRTFDEILFVTAIRLSDKPPVCDPK